MIDKAVQTAVQKLVDWWFLVKHYVRPTQEVEHPAAEGLRSIPGPFLMRCSTSPSWSTAFPILTSMPNYTPPG